MFKINQLDHIAITVANVENSQTWYKKVLGAEVMAVPWEGSPTFLKLGASSIALFAFEGAEDEKLQTLWDKIAIQHFAFRLDAENFEKAQWELPEKGIAVRFENHDICHSLYLKDPDGHVVELTCYEISI